MKTMPNSLRILCLAALLAGGLSAVCPAAESQGLLDRLLGGRQGAQTETADEATTEALGAEDPLERAREIGGEAGIREAAGLGDAPDILDDPEAMRALLGENPRWVWNIDPNEARSDPMLIPWVAEQLIFEARIADARALEGVGRLEEALDIYVSLLTQITREEYREIIEERRDNLMQRIAELQQQVVATAQGTPSPQERIVEPVLPQYIVAETRGIIYDPLGQSMVSVGDQNLRTGQGVEGFPGVIVKEITYQTVIFEVTNRFMTKEFTLKVQGDEVELQ